MKCFITFTGLSVVKNYVRPESAPLRENTGYLIYTTAKNNYILEFPLVEFN